MRQIRKSVFETNSSSTHSLCITNGELEKSTLHHDDYTIEIPMGEFGWEIEEYYSQSEKLSYLVTITQYNDEQQDLVREAIKEYTGYDLVIKGSGYVDHQSSDTLDELFEGDEETIKMNLTYFVFNNGYSFATDNDNY